MAMTDQVAALATRAGQQCKTLAAAVAAKYTLPGTGVPLTDLSTGAKTVGVMLYQTQGLHVAGAGNLSMGWVAPYNMVIDSVRYYCVTAGTGSTATAELRKNGTAAGNTIASSSATPIVAGSTAVTPGASISAGDVIYVFMTAVNTTTLGTGLAASIVGHRV